MDRFFIAGCQRSGTTLLRLVLECHPQIYCLDEMAAYRALAADQYTIPPGKTHVGFKVPRWTEQLGDSLLEDEGLEEKAHAVYRGEPIIFLLRDVRDTVASMVKLKVGDTPWLAVYGPPILEAKVRQPAFGDRYAADITRWRAAPSSLAVLGALYWKYKTAAYFDYRERGWPLCGIRYEDLVTAAEPELRRVLTCLNLPWHAALLDHPRLPHGELYADGTTVGTTDPKRPIHGESVGQWKQVLSSEDVAIMLAIAGELNERILSEPSREV
jgi:hypothetical protein